jgi:hypothetical protein
MGGKLVTHSVKTITHKLNNLSLIAIFSLSFLQAAKRHKRADESTGANCSTLRTIDFSPAASTADNVFIDPSPAASTADNVFIDPSPAASTADDVLSDHVAVASTVIDDPGIATVISKLDDVLISNIVRRGPIQPKDYNFPKTVIGAAGKSLSFQPKWYERCRTPKGLGWLEYSISRDAAYCFPCRLFARTDIACTDEAFIHTGFRSWKKATERKSGFSQHDSCNAHKAAVQKWEAYLQQQKTGNIKEHLSTLYAENLRKESEEAKMTQNGFQKIVKLIRLLAKLNLPFRGKSDSCSKTNKGVFKELLQLMAENDEKMAAYLLKNKGEDYTSHQCQNEIIDSLAYAVRKNIIDKVRQDRFYSVIMDESKDVSKAEQLAIVLRHVDANFHVQEHLLDVLRVSDMTGAAIAENFRKTLQKLQIPLQYCRGQSYDGGSNMAGKFNGCQAHITAENPKAIYVWCHAHRLNLVVVETSKQSLIIRNFFGLLERLFTFFSSPKKVNIFIRFQEQLYPSQPVMRLQHLSDTRWISRLASLRVIIKRMDALLASLSALCDDLDSSTCWEAKTLLENVNFEFILALNMMSAILEQTGVVSKYLQQADADLAEAMCQVRLLLDQLKEMRSEADFDKYYNSSLQISVEKNLGNPQLPRQGRPSKRFEPFTTSKQTHHSFTSARDYYRVNLYYHVLDTCIGELEKRFMNAALCPLYSNLRYLVPRNMTDQASESGILSLCQQFEGDIDPEHTVAEYRLLRNHPAVRHKLDPSASEDCETAPSASEVDSSSDCSVDDEEFTSSRLPHPSTSSLHVLATIIREGRLQKVYPSVSKLLKLCLTLPVTSVASERTFSKMRLIKSRIRSTMSDNRLCNLLLLSVEACESDNVDMSFVMQHFATAYTTQPRKKLCEKN